jgi:wyosine [tRNA(Phe)-imidazoG37] synthetase (radical SAM superfamily)
MSNAPTSTVYGPVNSWRVGRSLGIDLLFRTSICSFRCIYCQLGKIEEHTAERAVYVSTEKVMADLEASDWQSADIITLSGSGEPTLALNIKEVIHALKARTGKPVMVLTNATTLGDPQVRADLKEADKVFCKLDAADDRTLQQVDRPVAGITVRSIVDGIKALRAEYPGYLAVQSMFMPLNNKDVETFAGLLREIAPDEVQLNTPLRPVPKGWYIEARGNHERESAPYEAVELKHLTKSEAQTLEERLRELTKLKIVSCYKD